MSGYLYLYDCMGALAFLDLRNGLPRAIKRGYIAISVLCYSSHLV